MALMIEGIGHLGVLLPWAVVGAILLVSSIISRALFYVLVITK